MSDTISKSELVNHLNESAYEMHKHNQNTSAGILLMLRDGIQSGRFDTPEREHEKAYWAREGLIEKQREEIKQLRMSLDLAKKWLKDIENLQNPTSPLASTALMELQAIEDQYPLGIGGTEG